MSQDYSDSKISQVVQSEHSDIVNRSDKSRGLKLVKSNLKRSCNVTGGRARDILCQERVTIAKDMKKFHACIERELEEVSDDPVLGYHVVVHRLVNESRAPNLMGLRIPVKTNLNIQLFRSLLRNYQDKEVCDFLEFGWPIGYESQVWPEPSCKNHLGAIQFPKAVHEYLEKEKKYQAILGPFVKTPFTLPVITNPLHSVLKKDGNERRIILDLSYPEGKSVNDGIPKDHYLGKPINLNYPTVEHLVELVKEKGRGCMLFKRDLKRAYRQLPVDPGDIHLLGYQWNNETYVDRVLPMGLRSAALACQRTIDAITYMYQQMDYQVINYLDDFGGAESPEKAEKAFKTLGRLFQQLGVEESLEKAVGPTTRMVFLGIMLDTKKMQLEVPKDRLVEIQQLVREWQAKQKAFRREIESLLGKLKFVSQCVKSSKVFVTRILEKLRESQERNVQLVLDNEFKKDLLWWEKFIERYNGISMINTEKWGAPDQIIATDACLEGLGGVSLSLGEYWHTGIPAMYKDTSVHINSLEMLAVMLALKLWGRTCTGKRILINCDNSATVHVINSGKSRDKLMLACMREIVFITALYQFEIRAIHIKGVDNRLPDCLSRWNSGSCYRRQFKRETSKKQLVRRLINTNLFCFSHDW